MIILDIDQGSDEWLQARAGIPTASNFDKIVTSKGDPSKSATAYRHKLLGEWLAGPEESFKSDAMDRGNALEGDARSLYSVFRDKDIGQVGLIYKDDTRLVSCSPDGLMDNGGLEIKCPLAHTHIKYLMDNKLPSKYIAQVQGSMYVTGMDTWDFMSYHPKIAPLILTIERDNDYISKMNELIEKFIVKLLIDREKLEKLK